MTGHTPAPPAPPALTWNLLPSAPPDWAAKLRRAGGGFFHTPLGLALGAPRGEPLFAELAVAGEVAGVAAGVRSRCRFTTQPRHVYLPTLPLAPLEVGGAALSALVRQFKLEGMAEVVMDAFDAAWTPDRLPGAEDTRARQEYVVRVDGGPDELARRFSRHHQRGLRRGEREGWAFRTHAGRQARELLSLVQSAAAERASQRRDAFVVEPPPAAAALGEREEWGVTTFGAWRQGAPLAAALVGWANGHAFFLRGGSTAEGYRSNAAVWLHWRVMSELAARGAVEYNLGGAPARAVRPEDPAHGLHRFKRDFGSEIRPCRGLRWTLSPAHVQAHRLAPQAAWYQKAVTASS